MNFRFFHPIAAFALARDPVLESSLQKRAQSGVYCSQKPFPQVFLQSEQAESASTTRGRHLDC